MSSKSSRYSKQNEAQTFLPDEDDGQEPPFVNIKRTSTFFRRIFWLVCAANTVLFLVSTYWAVSTYRLRNALVNNHDNALLRMVDWYSPIHDQTQINIVDQKMNGTLIDMDHSLFRAPPSPEVDAAWERISSLAPHVINTEDVIRLGKDPSVTARFTPEWGFGDEAHVAEVDILHIIHCLNAVRRDVHWQYYFADKYPGGELPELHRVHTDHCIYAVLQTLMCGATADVVTQPWVEGQLHPFPDFSINKKCRDFGAILEWHERTMISDLDRFKTLIMPSGWRPLPMSSEFHRLFGTFNN